MGSGHYNTAPRVLRTCAGAGHVQIMHVAPLNSQNAHQPQALPSSDNSDITILVSCADEDESDSAQGYDRQYLAEARAQRQKSHSQATSSAAEGAQDAPQKRPAFYAQTPDGTRFSAGAFSDLHLSRPLLKACTALGYTHPTPIQVLSCIHYL